jgi:hypothetical protein
MSIFCSPSTRPARRSYSLPATSFGPPIGIMRSSTGWYSLPGSWTTQVSSGSPTVM